MFVHGLSANPATTWRPIFDLCCSDPAFREYCIDTYTYPTKLLRIPFTQRLPSLPELASGLKTEIESRHQRRSPVILVGHSLGGLIIRQYIVSELHAGRAPLADAVVLYATPSTGAALAKVGSTLSWDHKHLAQLCRGSTFIEQLNRDWVTLDVEAKVPVRFVVGGTDAVVPAEGSKLYPGQTFHMLIGHDHRTIVQASSLTDLRYTALSSFVNLPGRSPVVHGPPLVARKPNPLFDTYSVADEPFYVERPLDAAVTAAMGEGHVWVHGGSGLGKTAATVRSGLLSGWSVQPVLLASYQDKSAVGMFRAACIEICERATVTPPANTVHDGGELVQYYRKAFTALSGSQGVILFVDELPLGPGPDLAGFLDLTLQLSSAIAMDPKLSGRVNLAFATLCNPTESLPASGPKIRERFQFVVADHWQADELGTLVKILSGVVRPQLEFDDQSLIVEDAGGSPRFVKLLFKRWKFRTDGGKELALLLRETATEHLS